MKCLHDRVKDVVIRVSDDEAVNLIAKRPSGRYIFVSKTVWKQFKNHEGRWDNSNRKEV